MMQPWRRIDWTLADWLDHAWKLSHMPRHSRQVYDACTRHIQRFPAHLVGIECDRDTLRSLRALITSSHPNRFGRPSRGHRAGDWTTPVWMAVNNQLARLERKPLRNAP